MAEEIVNKVANSGLINLDLTDYAPTKTIDEIDLKQFLFEGFILKEKEFRVALKDFDWTQYDSKIAAINCSSDCIIPMWAFMLITSYLNKVAEEIHFGTKNEVFQKHFLQNIDKIDATEFEGEKVIVKGCGHIPLTEDLYIAITKKLQNAVSSLMFGEACSAVPVFKKK
jgi:kynurenine formamidase